jgi:hypothetical protein
MNSRISISWNLEPERRMVRALWELCFGRIGLDREPPVEALPDSLRRDVGLLPRETGLPTRDPRW